MLVVVTLLAACQPAANVKPGFQPRTSVKPTRVLLMSPDVELSLMTAGGLLEPKADWTAAGNANVRQAMLAKLAEKNTNLVEYRAPENDPQRLHDYTQIYKLYEAVGYSILTHHFNEFMRLPTKVDRFDWTLGPDVRALAEDYDADYGLFVFVRDSYTSAGRVAVILAAAVLGVGLPGGFQAGFASLVDLRTGEIVWFNRMLSGSGDLRTLEPAHKAVGVLLTDIPL